MHAVIVPQRVRQFTGGGQNRSPPRRPEEPAGVELSLEPNGNPAAKSFQEAMFAQGVPLAAFDVSNLAAAAARLQAAGVVFKQEPPPAGPVIIAIVSDTCGNRIQLYRPA